MLTPTILGGNWAVSCSGFLTPREEPLVFIAHRLSETVARLDVVTNETCPSSRRKFTQFV
jgi:hypothetical protein